MGLYFPRCFWGQREREQRDGHTVLRRVPHPRVAGGAAGSRGPSPLAGALLWSPPLPAELNPGLGLPQSLSCSRGFALSRRYPRDTRGEDVAERPVIVTWQRGWACGFTPAGLCYQPRGKSPPSLTQGMCPASQGMPGSVVPAPSSALCFQRGPSGFGGDGWVARVSFRSVRARAGSGAAARPAAEQPAPALRERGPAGRFGDVSPSGLGGLGMLLGG